jgi:integrase
MRAIIGAQLIKSKAAQSKEKPFEICDTRLSGFILRIQPSGYRSYYAEWSHGKRQVLGAVGHLLPDEARERCEKVLGNVAHGRPPLHGLDGETGPTVKAFLDDIKNGYAAWLRANRPKGAEQTLQRLETCFGTWYQKPLTDITVELIESWRTSRLSEGLKPATVQRDCMVLSGLLRHAKKLKRIVENPVAAVDKPKIDRTPKVRYLNPAEAQRLRDALRDRDQEMRDARVSANAWRKARKEDPLPTLPHYGDHLTPAVLVSLNTGLRRGELLALRWSSIDFKHKQLTTKGKSEQTQHIDLNPEAFEALKNWRKQAPDGERIFPYASFKTAFSALLERAKITKFRWHDLRHHFASRLVQSGVPLNTVRELLGHGSLAMTLRYAHLAPDNKLQAVAKLVW